MKIKIGCFTYDVKEIDREMADAKNIYGDINHTRQVISLSKGLSKERKKEVLLHEVLHGVYNQWSGVDRTDKSEELLVNQMAFGLSCVFKDNPKLKDAVF